ncbi:hypothetical protein BGZ80_004653, partial [Entomortierella chlamydospora]
TITTTIASIAGSSGALAVPDRARAALKNYNIDGLNTSGPAPSIAPEQTLSRKSSTISSDSGSTTISKSTNPSSTGSSPFNAAGPKNPQQQLQQYQQNQYQASSPLQQVQQPQTNASFDDFASLMNAGNNAFGNNALGNSALGNSALGNSAIGNSALGKNALGNSVIGNSALGNSALGNSALGNSALGNNALGSNAFGNNALGNNSSILGVQAFVSTPAADNSSDPFSLMTNAFNNMGVGSSHTSSTDSYPSNNSRYGSINGSGSGTLTGTGRAMSSQTSSSLSPNEFFATFSSGATSSASIHATNAVESSDPFSLGASSQSYLQLQQQQQQKSSQLGSLHGLDFNLSSTPQVNNTLPPTSTATSTGAGTGTATKSFDDYLSILGNGKQPQLQQTSTLSSHSNLYNLSSSTSSSPFSTPSASLSPQSTGVSNPFGQQAQPQQYQQQQQQQQQKPPQFQRALTTDSAHLSAASSSTNGQQGNPFAMFAKQQQQPVSSSPLQSALTGPFGRHQYQPQQQQHNDYFTMPGLNSSGTRSPNPFMMSGQTAQTQQGSMPTTFMRSVSDSSNNFQNAFNNNNINNTNNIGSSIGYSSLNGGVGSTANFESAFSVPAAHSRSMTVPVTSTNDMFGQWVKPSPVAANTKYPSIDDLDPFSASAPTAAAPASAFSNPFSLNM